MFPTDTAHGLKCTPFYFCSFDRAICIYDTEKLDKGRDCFKRIRDCARAAITSLALDSRNNVLLAGSLEGTLRVWSLEGRCLDKFEGLSSRPISVVHVPQTNVWWATGRFDRVNVCDPRAPANVTQYVAQPNQLMKHQVGGLEDPWGHCQLHGSHLGEAGFALCCRCCEPIESDLASRYGQHHVAV